MTTCITVAISGGLGLGTAIAFQELYMPGFKQGLGLEALRV